MNKIIFALPGNEKLTDLLCNKIQGEKGEAIIRHFPDGETYIRILSDVKDKKVILVCTLDHPDVKLLPLYFISKTAMSLGAESICLVAPYLAYMRQDKRFYPGEGITSTYFASLISHFAHSLICIDPHLHRRSALSEIYHIPTLVLHASVLISQWIKQHIKNPVLIGPDEESEQWIKEVAKNAAAPYIILRKIRLGDNNVEVSIPKLDQYLQHIPIIVDDIISTGSTMSETTGHLKAAGMKSPVCIAVHGIFSDDAYEKLMAISVQKVVTCNTIAHKSNGIDISDLIASVL